MPSHYAHYYFGKEVIKTAPDKIKDIVNTNGNTLDSFMIGLHGPDILFFYKAYESNDINKEGSEIHRKKGRDFFERVLPYIRENPTPENLSYILGFMCHFKLDTACHPLVNKFMSEESLSHSTVEMEFDSYLIRSLGKDPLKINQLPHIKSNSDLGEIISPFYETTNPKTLISSIDWMVKIINIMSASSSFKRKTTARMLKLAKAYDNHGGMIVTAVPNPSCIRSNRELFNKLKESVDEANNELLNLLDSIHDNAPLSDITDMDFNGDFIN